MRCLALTLLAVAVPLGAAAAPDTTPAAAPESAVTAHVQQVADNVARHLARAGKAPQVQVIERVGVVADRAAGGRLEVSTGLLGALRNDAELAMVLGYELARALPASARAPSRSSGSSIGVQVARAGVTAAAVGAVVYGVNDALSGSGSIARGAGVGAAGAMTGVAVQAAWPRRNSRPASRADDDAAAEGLRALVSAGYDGAAAVRAWDALNVATPLGGEDGSYGDHSANAKRESAATKALRQAGRGAAAGGGRTTGREAYSNGVLAHLAGGVYLKQSTATAGGGVLGSPRAAAEQPAAPSPRARVLPRGEAPTEPVPSRDPLPAGSGTPWLSYARSGGITGWSATLTIALDGAVANSSSRAGGQTTARTPLGGAELVGLRTRIAVALAEPPREPTVNLSQMRDGMNRTLLVTEGGTSTTLMLSDGYGLTPEDHDLVRVLEELVSRK